MGADESRNFPFELTVPPGLESTTDLIKAFVTLADVRFSWMQQDPLDLGYTPPSRGGARGVATGGLEALFQAIDPPKSQRRAGAALIASDTAWTVKQFRVTIERRA